MMPSDRTRKRADAKVVPWDFIKQHWENLIVTRALQGKRERARQPNLRLMDAKIVPKENIWIKLVKSVVKIVWPEDLVMPADRRQNQTGAKIVRQDGIKNKWASLTAPSVPSDSTKQWPQRHTVCHVSQASIRMRQSRSRARTVQPTSLQIKRISLRAKIAVTGKHHPLAVLRAFSVQLGKQARRRVLIVQQGSFEKEEVEMARLVLRAQQECTRMW